MKSHKVTNIAPGLHGRWYDDACGTAFALEVVGERWSLLIVRELMLGPRRFSDLRKALPAISAKVLTERLSGLEGAGVLRRMALPPPSATRVYELTAWGYAAEPALQELGRWAAQSPAHDPMLPLSPVSLMLSLRTMFDPARAAGMRTRIGFLIAGEAFLAEMADGKLPIHRVDKPEGDAILMAPEASILAGLFYAKLPVEELGEAGLIIEGDREQALRFIDIFELPAKMG